jgi:hypothetical protein
VMLPALSDRRGEHSGGVSCEQSLITAVTSAPPAAFV